MSNVRNRDRSGRAREIVLFSPSFPPAAGGAANYAYILTSLLSRNQIFDRVIVYTEWESIFSKSNERPPGVEVRNVFPKRTKRNKIDILSYLAYFVQMTMLPILILWSWRKNRTLWFHAYWLYRANTIFPTLRVLVRVTRKRPQLVLDVRDREFNQHSVDQIKVFDKIISCSHNVTRHLTSLEISQHRISEIPIPVEVDFGAVNDTKLPHNVSELGRYVLAAHGFTSGKNTENILHAIKMLRADGIDIGVVVIGRARYWPSIAEEGVSDGWVVFAGPVSNTTALAICMSSEIHINVCPTEGLPRSSLEAMVLGQKVILPPNVPEFDRYCSEYVVQGDNIKVLANCIKKVLTSRCKAEYPISYHFSDSLKDAYQRALFA
jgi:glycosyltransferase involved in cell wall biosynthesis